MRQRDRQWLEGCQKIIRVRDQISDAAPCSLGEEGFNGGAASADIMFQKMIDCISPS